MLADKNHVKRDTCWGLVELLPELHMERAYEDHELLVENLLMWKVSKLYIPVFKSWETSQLNTNLCSITDTNVLFFLPG